MRLLSLIIVLVVPKSEIRVKMLASQFHKIGQKCCLADFRPSIDRENGHNKFHTRSSTHQELKFHRA